MNIRTLCLGVLQFGDATGYEINKLVTEGRFSHFIEASYGSIYPALTRMMAEELVTCREEQQEGRPARKIYSLTEKGRAQLFAALEDFPGEDRFRSDFLFHGLFASQLPPNHVDEMIRRHIRHVNKIIAELTECHERCQHPGSRFAIGLGIAANTAMRDYIEANRHLLEQTGEASAPLPACTYEEPTR